MGERATIDQDYLHGAADAIRRKNGTSNTYTPAQFEAAIDAIPTGGITPTGTINITENGDVDVTDYATAHVAVSGGGGGGIITGSDAPSASQGSDGDVYLRVMPIPSNVDFVEYLESNGTQYIDTGIVANQGTDVMCDIGWKGDDYILGARTGSASDFTKALFAVGGSGSSFGLGKAGTTNMGLDSFKWSSYSTNQRIKAWTKSINRAQSEMGTGNYKNLSCNVTTGSHPIIRNNYSDFTCEYTQILFGIGRGNTPSKASSARIYRVVYFQAGSPIHDYLPCLDGNGVACMWDNIAGEYVYNDGTGDFTYGSTVTPDALDPVYYVKKNGAWEVIQ